MPRSESDKAEDARLIRLVEDRWRTPWARERGPLVQKYLLNHSYLNGNPYVRATSSGLENIPRGSNKYKVRSIINILRPTIRSLLGQLTSGRSQVDVLPGTTDFQDEAVARVAEQLSRAFKRITRADRMAQRNWISLFKGGTTLMRVLWDAGRGVPNEEPVTDSSGEELSFDLVDRKERPASEVAEILADMENEQDRAAAQEIRFVPVTEPTFPGDVSLDLYSILEFMSDPSPLFLSEQTILITERARSLEWIRTNGALQHGDEVVGEHDAIILFDRSGSGRMAPGSGLPRTTGGSTLLGKTPDFAIVRELEILPMEFNPLLTKFDQRGRVTEEGDSAPLGVHFIWAGDVVLTSPTQPLPYAETPQTEKHDVGFDFSDYRWFPEEGFYGSNLISDVIPIIRSLNRRDSQIKESINATVHAIGLIPTGSRIRRSTITDQAGDWVEYSGEKPSYLEPPALRQYVMQTVELDTRHFNDVMMTHEVTRQGSVPPNLRTADALRALQESDVLPLRPVLQEYEASEEITYQLVLDRIMQWYDEDRTIYYAGDKNRLETLLFKRSDFFKYAWKVSIRRGSSLPVSRAAQIAEAREMAQFAPMFFVDPQTRMFDRALWARAAGREDLEELLEEEDQSRQAAEMEHIELSAGIPVQVMPYEVHVAHLKVHYPFVRSPDFKKLDGADIPPGQLGPLQTNFMQHVSQHEQALQRQAEMMGQTGAALQQAASDGAQKVRDQAVASAAASEARKLVQEQVQGGGDNGAASGRERLAQQLTRRPPQ